MFKYLCTVLCAQVHCLVGCPKNPHGQGFIAATSIIELGYVSEPATREIVTLPSSNGWRNASITSRLNSGSSSKNSTPLCAKEISPGFGTVPPPAIPATETVWWGERKGRWFTNGFLLSSVPAMEWILVVSIDSSKVISGSIPGSRFASILLPEPGGPTKIILCPPAAATSNAFLAAI